MIKETLDFNTAYNDYYKEIHQFIQPEMQILEVGGGAHPSVINRKGVQYSVIDPDQSELEKSPSDIIKINSKIEEMSTEQTFDIIVSKMVLEHIQEPNEFHTAIFNHLKPNGIAIHFFACKYSLPSIFNRIFPERLGSQILKLLKNRTLEESPKYKAYYARTMGFSNSQREYFKSFGFEILKYNSYIGHKYFQNIPVLKQLESVYGFFLKKLNLKVFSTVALVTLKKECK